MRVVKTKIGNHRGFHSLSLQYLGFTPYLAKDERLVLDLFGNENAYQDDINNKNTWNNWFIQEDWEESEVVREVGGVNHGSFIGGWVSEDSRLKLHKLSTEHLKVQKSILDKVDTFINQNFRGHRVLGIHIRGNEIFTDNTRPKLPFSYFKHKIDLYLNTGEFDKIFVATDQIHTLLKLKELYKEDLLHYSSLEFDLMGSHAHIFNKITPNEGYIRGEEVLIDSILLSSTDFLLRTCSNITAYSIIYNPLLKYCEIDYPFYSHGNYAYTPSPSCENPCKLESNFDFFIQQVRDFESKLSFIPYKDRAEFVKQYL